MARFVLSACLIIVPCPDQRFRFVRPVTLRFYLIQYAPEHFKAVHHHTLKLALGGQGISNPAQQSTSVIGKCPLDNRAFWDVLQANTTFVFPECYAIDKCIFITQTIVPGC